MNNSNKRFTPGTNPSWGIELPDEDDNSLVDKYGSNWDNGYNFDERDYDEAPAAESSFESLAKERELAEYAKDQIIYAGIFVNAEELYEKFPPSLSHKIRDPHVTVSYRPDESKMFLDALGSEAEITIVGYGIDEEMGNEGLLAVVRAKNPEIQKALNERFEPDANGNLEYIRTHVTTSISAEKGAQAYDTRKLDFKPLDEPVVISGSYNLFRKDGALIKDKETISKMKEEGFSVEKEVDPDLL